MTADADRLADTAAAARDQALLADLVAQARRRGADAADALLVDSRARTATIRNGQIERLEGEESRDLGLRLFRGTRAVVISTSDDSAEGRAALIDRALAMVDAVPEDPTLGLARPDQIAMAPSPLDSNDPDDPAAERLLALAQAAEDTARATPGITNSEGASASWGRSLVTLAASNGFTGHYAVSRHSLSVSVLAGEGTAMETDYDYDTRVYGADLRAPEAIGAEAARRTVARLNPRKVASTKAPVVLDPRVASGLLRSLAGAINGSAIARQSSFLADRLGSQVFARGITIRDDPTVRRGLRSRAFDSEGLPVVARDIIADGVLTSWILDLRTARQLGLPPTGHASRGVGGHPSPSVSNFWLMPGEVSPDTLIAQTWTGLYVTDTMGSGTNLVTGDFSVGAAGFWIEEGALAYPVSEVTIAGHLSDIFASLTPANDLTLRTGIDSPTVRVEGITIAGR